MDRFVLGLCGGIIGIESRTQADAAGFANIERWAFAPCHWRVTASQPL
jgi:hypothetical protein